MDAINVRRCVVVVEVPGDEQFEVTIVLSSSSRVKQKLLGFKEEVVAETK